MRRYEVAKLSIHGNPNIGAYIQASDSYVLLPPEMEEKDVKLASEVLGTERLVKTTVLSTRLLGTLTAGNSRGLLLPRGVSEEERRRIAEALSDVSVSVLDARENALGNLIAANDRAAAVYPKLDRSAMRLISDVLGVEVVPMTLCGTGVVGSVLVVTSRGGIVCSETSEEELKALRELFKVPIIQGTVNFGVSLIRVGLVANSYGALVGEETTGPEIARIQMALGGEG